MKGLSFVLRVPGAVTAPAVSSATSMSMVTVEIDLAKNVFALHSVSSAGTVVLRQPKVARAKLHELVAAQVDHLARPKQWRELSRCKYS